FWWDWAGAGVGQPRHWRWCRDSCGTGPIGSSRGTAIAGSVAMRSAWCLRRGSVRASSTRRHRGRCADREALEFMHELVEGEQVQARAGTAAIEAAMCQLAGQDDGGGGGDLRTAAFVGDDVPLDA